MKTIHNWVKTLSPGMQSLYYAIETGVAAALALFGYHLLDAITTGGWDGLTHFDWIGQLRILAVAAIAAVLKAGLDAWKGARPVQEPAAPPAT